MYKNSSHVMSASEYGHGVYSNAVENVFSHTTSCEETILHVLGT